MVTGPQVLQLSNIASSPWKNGGGSTRQIAAGPGWRVSSATVQQSGPFSVFDAMTRHSVVTDGDAMDLVGLHGKVLLLPHQIATYRGDLLWQCFHRGGSTTVMNIMCQDGQVTADVLTGDQACFAAGTAGTLIVIPIHCAMACWIGGQPVQGTTRGTVLVTDTNDTLVCRMQEPDESRPGYLLAVRLVHITAT